MAPDLPAGDVLFDKAACALLLAASDGTILKANSTACTWLGYSHAQLAGGRRMQDLLPIGARLFFHTHCQPILEVQGSVAEIQVDLRTAGQERLPVLINIVRHTDGEQVLHHWAFFKASDRKSYERELRNARNVAETALEARRGAEEELKKLNAQLSAADRRKDEFLATLSHELRNPLAPMRSALDVLALKFSGSADGRLLHAFDRQLRHLTRLVDDLMEVSRITQGRMQLRCAPVELAALVRGVAQDLAPTMEAARHTLRVQVAQDPVHVDGDATRLAQVVLNLLTNAAKYTPEGGLIELHLECDGGMAQVRVCDNGIGIPAEALATVFDMFSQLEPALERSRGGLGIGLALVRGVVELHGGTIRADSAGCGLGSTFTVRLPVADPVAGPAVAPVAAALPDSIRVLVVDDNEDAAETVAMALEWSGCEVRVAHSASQAMAQLAAFVPDAALLDIGLPDINGYELARRIRALPGTGRMVLIAATGWGQQKDRERAFDAGFDHHLTKPIDFELLRPLLGQAVRSAS